MNSFSPETPSATPPESASEASEAPSESPPPAQKSFARRCPVTLASVVFISGVYALTSYANGFDHPSRAFVLLGGFYPPFVHAGEWWRYLTATLLHGNPAHWFNNCAGLLIFGRELEPVLGPWSLLGLYVISAVTGLWLSSIMMPDAMTYGASTVDFGLIGAYLSLVLLLRLGVNRSLFWKELRGSLIFVALFVTWNLMESATVNLWGHVGGFIAGILFMLVLWNFRQKTAPSP